ncbi:hypothetical protein K1719_034615 [Acacia pycnantha]|nr:hypothetical protein K1719_034615 [Acacia pycnantha]
MEEEEETVDFGTGTDFDKVLNPSDGITVDYSNPLCPKFSFEEPERERLMKPFKRTLVVKLLGRQPAYGFMHNDDYMGALTGGPWVILDAYLNVARWRPEFCPKKSKIESVVAWVRLPDLPAPLFDKKFLLNLGNAIGKAIRLDIHTAQRARGKFARMCVELDLTRPLIPEFNVDGKVLSVVYESLGLLCTKCGWVGHRKDGCVEFHRKRMEVGMEVEVPEGNQRNENKNGEERELWKTVQRVRRPRKDPVLTKAPQQGSRFTVLDMDVGEEGMVAKGAKEAEGDEANECLKAAQKEVSHGAIRRGMEASSSKSVAKGVELKKTSNIGMATKDGKKEKVGYNIRKAGIFKGGDEKSGTRGSQQVLSSLNCETECGPDSHRRKGVSLTGKENLNPGDQFGLDSGEVDMDFDDMVQNGDSKDPIETCSKNKEVRCMTPKLADAK